MRRIRLPNLDVELSRLGFGCSSLMGAGSRSERMALLCHALDQGITHFDVARYYGLGFAEEELGFFLKSNRDKVTVTTKFGIAPYPLLLEVPSRFLEKIKANRLAKLIRRSAGKRTHLFSVNQAKAALHSSLRKLKVDTIDIYMLHDCNRYDVESDELLDFLNTSKTEGKIRAFGLATEIDSIVEIEQSKSAFSQVLQFENSVLFPNILRIHDYKYRAIITHRSLSTSFLTVQKKVCDFPAKAHSLSETLGIDLANPKCLAAAMLSYALSMNLNGVVLFSSRNKNRIEENSFTAQNQMFDAIQLEAFSRFIKGFS